MGWVMFAVGSLAGYAFAKLRPYLAELQAQWKADR